NKGGHITLIDDYGHHPREIEVTMQAARQSWPGQRLVMVYQPHRYTRTRDLFGEFCEVLSRPDALILLDVYSAGVNKIECVEIKNIVHSIQAKGKLQPILVEHHHELDYRLQD